MNTECGVSNTVEQGNAITYWIDKIDLLAIAKSVNKKKHFENVSLDNVVITNLIDIFNSRKIQLFLFRKHCI